MTSEEFSEIKRLLEEVRDLQKAHFERYCAFTDQVLAADQQARESAASSAAEHEAFIQSQLNYQEEMRRVVLSSQRQALMGIMILIGFMLLMAFAYVFVNSTLLPSTMPEETILSRKF